MSSDKYTMMFIYVVICITGTSHLVLGTAGTQNGPNAAASTQANNNNNNNNTIVLQTPTLMSYINNNTRSHTIDIPFDIRNSNPIETELTSDGRSSGQNNNNILRTLPNDPRQMLGVAVDDTLFTNQASVQPTRATRPVFNAARLSRLLERRRAEERRIRELRQMILRQTSHGNNRPAGPVYYNREAFAAWSRDNGLPLITPPQPEKHCYRAVCSLPQSTNNLLWSNESEPGLRLFFSVPRLNQRGGQPKQLNQARLKLFVKPARECPCPDDAPPSRPSTILVRVFQFIRPLSYRKRNRIVYRRQFLDSILLSGEGNVWLRLDVKRAVSLWMNRSRRNFGLEVIVSDLNGTNLDAKEILSGPQCERGTERSCREDNNQRIEHVLWPSMTLGEDNEPYIDVETVRRTDPQFLSRPTQIPTNRFPLSRRTRSVNSPSSLIRMLPRQIKKMQQSKKAVNDFVNKMKAKTSISRKVGGNNGQQSKLGRFLRKIHRKPSSRTHNKLFCSCDSHQDVTQDASKKGRHIKNQINSYKFNSLRSVLSKSSQSSYKITNNRSPSCRGKHMTVYITDKKVLAPRSYTTMVCPKRCQLCRKGKCHTLKCKPGRHRPVRVIVRTSTGHIKSQIHPHHQIVTACGC